MTADNSNETTGPASEQGAKPRGRKASRKNAAAKRGRTTASRRSAAAEQPNRSRSGNASSTRSRRRSGRSTSSSASSGGIGARLLASAGRAIPLATRSLPDQRMVQRLVDERPYMLGAIGLGIGAMIGLMLPGTLSSMTRRAPRGRSR